MRLRRGGHAVPVVQSIRRWRQGGDLTIPIVFIAGEDPVRLGLVASLARPGGNLTGINFFSADLTAKRLELLRELVPAARHLAVLVNPADAEAKTVLRDMDTATRAMGLQIQILNVSTSREIEAAFSTLVCSTGPTLSSSPPTGSSLAGASNL
jgi:ABC-type uncharacterized transport system substrate-binding protein